MSKITLDNLSDNLKDYLNGLGLTEEQVNTLVQNILVDYATKDDLENIDLSKYQELEDVDLVTENKTIVGAINELFQSANNGKQLIASAIGEPLDSSDTFSAMSTDINGLLSTFKTNMMNNGVTVESGDKFKSLIDKIATLADSEGKGVQIIQGESVCSSANTFTTIDGTSYTGGCIKIPKPDFTPMFILAYYEISSYAYYTVYNSYMSSIHATYSNNSTCSYKWYKIDSNVTSSTKTDIYLPVQTPANNTNYTYYAIGVGEEDTTLRDSLASILTEEGVSVSDEDDMASLITKVDEEFDRKNANNVIKLEGTTTYETINVTSLGYTTGCVVGFKPSVVYISIPDGSYEGVYVSDPITSSGIYKRKTISSSDYTVETEFTVSVSDNGFSAYLGLGSSVTATSVVNYIVYKYY